MNFCVSCAKPFHRQAALSAVLRSMLRPGDVVVGCKDIYGGMHRLLHAAEEHSGIEVHFVET